MKINDNATGIIIKGDDYTYVKAVRKPESDCKITKEIWFKGTFESFKEVVKE